MNRKFSLGFAAGSIAGILVVAGFAGFLSESLSGQRMSDKIGISGYAVVKAYHADGTLYATWEGHNALMNWGKNAIAACVTGLSTTPVNFGSCSGWITRIHVYGVPLSFSKAATNTLTPAGCNPSAGPYSNLCTGWTSSATFDSEITQATSLAEIYAIYGPSGTAFDKIDISPPISVSPGDRLIVTITFTIA